MKLKIKNLFMQFFVFTPLTLIQTFMFWGVIAYILTYDEENTVNRMNGFAVIKVHKVAKVFYQSIYNKKILI